MAGALSRWLPSTRQTLSSRGGRATLVAGAAGTFGVLLVGLGVAFGPAAVAAAPLLLLVLGWAVQRPLVAAAAIPLSLPFGATVLPGGLQVVHAAVLLAVVVVAAHRLSAGRGLLPAPPGTAWLLLLLGLIAAAVVFAADRAVAVNQTVTATIGGLGILAVVGACQTLTDVRRLVGLTLAAGATVCATAVSQLSSVSSSTGGVNVSGATGIFSEHNQFGAFAAAIVLFAIGMLFGGRSRWARWGGAVGGAVAVGAVGLALSRGAYIGTALGALVFILAYPLARRRFVTAAAVVLLGVVVTAVLVPNNPELSVISGRLASLRDPAANPEDDRPAIWAEALRQIKEAPLTGSGPANFPVQAVRADSTVSFAVPAHAHDVVLTVAAEAGLPAAAVLIVLTVLWTRRILGSLAALPDPRDRAMAAGLAGAAATFVGEGLFDAAMRSAVILMLLCLCTGLALAVVRHAGMPEVSPVGGMRMGAPGARAGVPSNSLYASSSGRSTGTAERGTTSKGAEW